MDTDISHFPEWRMLANRFLKLHPVGPPLSEEEGRQMAYALLATLANIEHREKQPGKFFPQHWSGYALEWGAMSKEDGERILACVTACRYIPQPILKAMTAHDSKVKILLEITP